MTIRRWLPLLGLLAGCKDDVPNPADLLVKEIPIPPNYGVHDTFIRDGIAFVCAWNTGVIIYDVGDGRAGGSPANPIEISRLVTSVGGVPGGAAVHNAWWFHNPATSEKKYLFIGQEGAASIPTVSNGDIHVVDVSNLAQPVEVASYRMTISPQAGTHNFWVDEPAQVLYAAYYNGGVVAIDVSGTLTGSLASREIARIKPAANSFVWGVQGSGGWLYATDMLNGLYRLKLTGTAFEAPVLGSVPERYTADLQVNGNTAYTGTWGGQPRGGVTGNALKIWDIGANGTPTLVDSIIIAGVATVSDVKSTPDNKLLVVSTEGGPAGGLYLYSLADPRKPALLVRDTTAAGMHTARAADVNGRTYVFAARNAGAGGGPSLRIYDVTTLVP